ncbi:hypothetical protein SAMN05444266_101747 [Chitinophaga jiangningensis]|uniref:Uncharacterized protein n=1 Tax=Chitinophaga jiangningensis TaxID=1419482 RepID=A0A1M6WSA6_9BACT|nr:hypothetical protein SAMN05444266_101747 [Chitinophaga jiangningensis]
MVMVTDTDNLKVYSKRDQGHAALVPFVFHFSPTHQGGNGVGALKISEDFPNLDF